MQSVFVNLSDIVPPTIYRRFVFTQKNYEISFQAFVASGSVGVKFIFKAFQATTQAWTVTLDKDAGQVIWLTSGGGAPLVINTSVTTAKEYKVVVNSTNKTAELFIDGVSQGVQTIVVTTMNIIEIEVVSTNSSGGVARFDEIRGGNVVALLLDFEPPEYATGDVDGQDQWANQIPALPRKMTVINDPTKVIAQTQSLSINMDATVGFQGFYIRPFATLTDYTVTWTWKYTVDPSDNTFIVMQFRKGIQFNVQFTFGKAFGFGPALLIAAFVDNPFIPGLPSAVFQPISLSDVTTARNYLVKIDKATKILRFFIDGVLVFSSSTRIFVPEIDQLFLFGFAPSLTIPTEVILDDFTIRKNEALPKLKAPQNAFAIRRENYTIVSWDQVTELEDGTKLTSGILRYEVARFNSLNETDVALKFVIDTINLDTNRVDTILVDTNAGEHSYRVKAIAIEGDDVLESEFSERSTATKSSAQIDDKKELIDRNIFVLGESKLGKGVLA